MRKALSWLLLIVVSKGYSTDILHTDICVYGGTSAGVIAAYAAIRSGKSALLISPGKHPGGMSSGGLGHTDIGNKYAITGLALDFYRRIGRHYGNFEQWTFEPHVAEQVFYQYLREGKVPAKFNFSLSFVKKTGSAIREISVADNGGHTLKICAKIFIDCSYEGDLMAKSGVSYAIGREDNRQYNETYNGIQLQSGHQFPDGIDPYRLEGKPESGLLWGISPASLLSPGSGDQRIQAYNFRICLTKDPKDMQPINRPPDYDSTHYELLLRVIDKSHITDLKNS